jgi:hypothetical protein
MHDDTFGSLPIYRQLGTSYWHEGCKHATLSWVLSFLVLQPSDVDAESGKLQKCELLQVYHYWFSSPIQFHMNVQTTLLVLPNLWNHQMKLSYWAKRSQILSPHLEYAVNCQHKPHLALQEHPLGNLASAAFKLNLFLTLPFAKSGSLRQCRAAVCSTISLLFCSKSLEVATRCGGCEADTESSGTPE